MTKNDVMTETQIDENNGNGEILEVTDDYVSYFDYEHDITITFRFAESITDEYMRSIIKIGANAKNKGLTQDFIIDVLKKVFKDDYNDAVCALSGIMVPSNEKEYYEMFDGLIRTGDNAREFYDYDDENHCVGRMFFAHQIVFINEAVIAGCAKNLGDEIISEKEEYETGVIMTLIHEIRHLMMDTHIFLPEDEFPPSESSEDAVEEFCRNEYEKLGELKRFPKR